MNRNVIFKGIFWGHLLRFYFDSVLKASISFWKAPCREILENLKNDQKAFSFRAPAVKAFQNQRDKEYYKIQ